MTKLTDIIPVLERAIGNEKLSELITAPNTRYTAHQMSIMDSTYFSLKDEDGNLKSPGRKTFDFIFRCHRRDQDGEPQPAQIFYPLLAEADTPEERTEIHDVNTEYAVEWLEILKALSSIFEDQGLEINMMTIGSFKKKAQPGEKGFLFRLAYNHIPVHLFEARLNAQGQWHFAGEGKYLHPQNWDQELMESIQRSHTSAQNYFSDYINKQVSRPIV